MARKLEEGVCCDLALRKDPRAGDRKPVPFLKERLIKGRADVVSHQSVATQTLYRSEDRLLSAISTGQSDYDEGLFTNLFRWKRLCGGKTIRCGHSFGKKGGHMVVPKAVEMAWS